MTPAHRSPDFSVRWLVRLRWTAIVAQTATVALCHYGLGVALPLAPLTVVLSLAAVSQLPVWLVCRRAWVRPTTLVGGVLALDTLLLTALLYLTGGPHNPFSAFYLIHVAMAASLLSPGWTWALLALAVGCYSGLFRWHVPLGLVLHGDPICGLRPVELHLAGMLVALTLTGVCLAWFIARINSQLRDRDAALHAAALRMERESRLAAIAALAAGVAHEISSPLGSIAVASRELEREIDGTAFPPRLAEEVRFIRQSVENCRQILGRLRAGAEPDHGDPAARLHVAEIVSSLSGALHGDGFERVQVRLGAPDAVCHAPRLALVQALVNLLSNALDASPPGATVLLEIVVEGPVVRFTVVDQGPGLPPLVAAQPGEAFVTTKEPGQGTGLGLFLVRRFAEAAGGSFTISSTPTAGTRARLEVPREARG